jgi:VWFA-related protein
MVRWFLAPILAGALISITGSLGAGAQQQDQVRVSPDTQAFPSLRNSVTVLDGSGRSVAGLDSQAFKVSVDGKPVPITSFTTGQDPNTPAAVVLAFDTSGSMAGAPIEEARQAGKALVGQLGPADQAAVITFSDTVQGLQGFTSDRGALTAAIDRIAASGNTALYDGVVSAVNLSAQQAPAQRRAIVLLSDGKDEGGVSRTSRDGSLAAAQAAGIPVFAVGLGQSIDQAYLQDLANVTRGQLFLAPSPEVLQGLYATIGTTLRQQYVLDVDGSGLDPAAPHTLRIEVNNAGIITSGDAPLDLSRFAQSPAATPQVTLEATVASTSVGTPAGNGAEGGGSSVLIAAAGGVLLLGLAGAGGVIYWSRRRRRALPPELRTPRTPWRPGTEDAGAVFVGTGPLDPLRADAWLESTAHENGGRFPLGEDPVTVGFTGDCTICLPDGAGQAGARVRVWRREGVYMLHNLSRLGKVTIGGKPTTWAVLEDGDEIVIGGSTLTFRMPNQSTGPKA